MSSVKHNKRRGAAVEKTVADYLAKATGLAVERRRLEGTIDRGDLAGLPNVVVEIKSGQPCLTAWLRETETERVNAGAMVGVLWWAPEGTYKTPARHVVIVQPPADELETRRLVKGQFPPLRCNLSMLGWHVNAVVDRYGIHPEQCGGYRLDGTNAFVTAGVIAAHTWNWEAYA